MLAVLDGRRPTPSRCDPSCQGRHSTFSQLRNVELGLYNSNHPYRRSAHATVALSGRAREWEALIDTAQQCIVRRRPDANRAVDSTAPFA